jgi:hypothetical protein
MSFVTCNKSFVKELFTWGKTEATVHYRYYLIAKAHFKNRSGIFSIDEFMDLLFHHYGYKSLHKRPGNSRTRYKRTFLAMFESSHLFFRLSDGRVKYVPERKILSRKILRRSTQIQLPYSDLAGAKRFTDRMIGIVSSGNYLKSYQTMAEETAFSRRRCIEAVKDNNHDNTFIKVNNYILVKSSQYKSDILQDRRDLLSIHNIQTPQPIRYHGEWYLCLYAPNSYVTVSFDARSTKNPQGGDDVLDITLEHADLTPYIHNKKCYYKRVPLSSNLYRRFKRTGFFTFNEDNFSFQKYIDEYSHLVGEVRSIA